MLGTVPLSSGTFFGAPGRAHPLEGASPLLARQGEELAQGKGFAGDCESEGSLMAKRWPDAQEADEALHRGKAAKIVKARYLYGMMQRTSDRHKRESGFAIPGEI
jgi:hypothetical protein